MRLGERSYPFRKDATTASSIETEKAAYAHTELDAYVPPGEILQGSLIAAVHASR
jgi:hypothetical protein